MNFQSKTSYASATETISIRIKENKLKLDVCNLYKIGKVQQARELLPEYVSSLESKNAFKSDFILGGIVLLLSILVLIFYVLPLVRTSQFAIAFLFVGLLSLFFVIEYATKQIRFTRALRYLDRKEVPKLKREIETQKTSIDTLMSEDTKKKDQFQSSSKQSGRQNRYQREKKKRHFEQQGYGDDTSSEGSEDTFTQESGDRFRRQDGKMTPQGAYKVLELPDGSSKSEIQKAYRDAIIQYHPDRVAHMADEFRLLAEERSKIINEAYELLKQLL